MRKKYDKDFKLMMMELLESGQKASKLSEEYDVNVQMIYPWKAKRVIFQYIEGFYNNNRLHPTIAYMTPNEKEKQLLMQLKNVA